MNINFKWLSVEDFKGRFKITENIPAKDLDIAVTDAYEFDVLTALPDTLMSAIKEVLLINPIQWSASKTYSIGHKVKYDGTYYVALDSNTNSLPTPLNADWSELDLMTFWSDYVQPYFMCCSYYRFLNWHGANVTQYGVRQNNEDTSNEVTDKRKGELMADIAGKQDIFLARLTSYFNGVNQTLDGVVYAYDSKDSQELTKGVRIWGVKKRSSKNFRDCCPDDYL